MNNKLLAKIFSYIFIPPMMNLIIFILFAGKLESEEGGMIVFTSSLFFGFLLPIITFIFLRKKGKVVNNDATIKEERTIPYLYGIVYSSAATIFLYFNQVNELSTLLWLSYLLNSIFIILINKSWKISAHAMGAAIPFGASFILGGVYPIIFGIILLLIAWARYELRVHTILPIIAGSFLGFTVTYSLLSYI